MPNFKDTDEFREWLKQFGDDTRVGTAMASRSALRVLPAVMFYYGDISQKKHAERLLLFALRAILTSAVAATCPTADVPDDVVTAALSADSALSALSPALSADSDYSSDTRKMFQQRLWHRENGIDEFNAHWQEFKQNNPNGPWQFWCEWYQGFLDGKPLNWDLQHKIALIPDVDWEKGPERIAKKIAKIKKGFDDNQDARGTETAASTTQNITQAVKILIKHPITNSTVLHDSAYSIWDTIKPLGNQFGEDKPDFLVRADNIAKIHFDISKILRENANFKRKNAKLKQKNADLKQKNDTLNLKVASLTGEIRGLRAALNAKDSKFSQITVGVYVTVISGALGALGAMGVDFLRDQRHELKDHIEQLQNEVDEELPTDYYVEPDRPFKIASID